MFESSRGGMKLNFDGFTYQMNKIFKDKYYWSCEMRTKSNCQSKVITKFNEKIGMHVHVNKSSVEHNHEPDAMRRKVADIISKIKEEAASNLHKTPAQIIREYVAELAATSPEVLPNLPSAESIKQIIYRVKKKANIKKPETIEFQINKSCLE